MVTTANDSIEASGIYVLNNTCKVLLMMETYTRFEKFIQID